MRTNIDIDDQLIREAMEILQVKTKKAAVEAALRLVKRRAARDRIRSLRGKVEMFPETDHQATTVSP